jgi:carbon-monoxide dehydrogenase medium subunit
VVSAPFAYKVAASYEEAAALLAEYGEDAKLIAGGQSLVPMMNLRLVRPAVLVDLNGIGAVEPHSSAGELRLSALTRHRVLAEPSGRISCPLLTAAAKHVGNPRVRARGTIGGSLSHGDPTAELAAACLALGGRVSLLSPRGVRQLSVDELLVSFFTTAIEADEVLTEVVVPLHVPGQTGAGFHEMVRRASDLAIVAVAAYVELDPGVDVVRSARVSVAGVSDRVILASADEVAPVVGVPTSKSAPAEVASRLAESVDPASDVHASAEYRRRLVAVLARRALEDALSKASSRWVAA